LKWQLRPLQTIDGLEPTASNRVVRGIPVEVMDAVNALMCERQPKSCFGTKRKPKVVYISRAERYNDIMAGALVTPL
jgi:hypothetical protein